MKIYKDKQFWFVVGSQHLYGAKTLEEVAKNANTIASFLEEHTDIPAHIAFKGILTTSSEITNFLIKANADSSCTGVIFWMHTFSPAKMWINGLKHFTKPKLHLHTQYNRDIPWDTIDMDYMNTNQSAHGGREFGYINTRLHIDRKVVTGYWQSSDVIEEVSKWMRVACAYQELQTLKIARFEDNMRNVAVTEGDKVDAQIQFGYSVDGFGIGDLVEIIQDVTDAEANALMIEYQNIYKIDASMLDAGANIDSLRYSAKIEIALRRFLDAGGYMAFTTNFESLHGMKQLPGMAVQRLMAQGYGFGGEGDWKVAALVYLMKIMGTGMGGGTSFMEDYVYHFHPDGHKVLGSHMLEVCPSIGEKEQRVEIYPLSIGGKEDPVRIVFNVPKGEAINVGLIDMGNRFRFIINEVYTEEPTHRIPNLPVARALWTPKPNLKIAATSWILAGGSHHTCFSKDVDTQMLLDFAEMVDVEALVIDKNTDIRSFKNEMRWNEILNTNRR